MRLFCALRYTNPNYVGVSPRVIEPCKFGQAVSFRPTKGTFVILRYEGSDLSIAKILRWRSE